MVLLNLTKEYFVNKLAVIHKSALNSLNLLIFVEIFRELKDIYDSEKMLPSFKQQFIFMKRVIKYIFSMEMVGVLMVLAAFSMGLATFIENDFGTAAAKALVYNSWWFELVITLTMINLIYSLTKMRPWKTKKWSIYIFHLAFVLIILGAAITRFIGSEGLMSIREGQESHVFLSEHSYMMVQDEQGNILAKKKVLFSSVSQDEVDFNFDIQDQEYQIHTYDFIPNAVEYVDEAGEGPAMLELTRRENGQFKSYTLQEGEQAKLKGYSIGFGNDLPNDIQIEIKGGELMISAIDSLHFFDMMTNTGAVLAPDSLYALQLQKLYSFKDLNWVIKKYYPHAVVAVTARKQMNKNMRGLDAIRFNILNSEDQVLVSDYVMGSSGYSSPKDVLVDGEKLKVVYGSEEIELPFSIKLRDFQLERYPASNSPSSYASEVTLVDKPAGVNMDFRIYMNHVLDYKGYRFFQSSYDQDEMGTVLSVNHDFWGMAVTYLGYAFMMLGMFSALFTKKSRFRHLMRKTVSVLVLLLGFSFLSPAFSQDQDVMKPLVGQLPDQQIDDLSHLLVQGHSGRFQPFNSVSNRIVRKFSRKTTYDGLNSDRILLGMMMNPDYWVQQPIIKVTNNELKKIIGVEASRARFIDFFVQTENGNQYKLDQYVNNAYQKKPGKRGKFEKDLITVDERVNVFYMGITSNFVKIFPVPDSPNSEWMSPQGPFTNFHGEDSSFVSSVFTYYLQSLRQGVSSGDYSNADLMLKGIRQYQDSYAPYYQEKIQHLDLEIAYNKLDIFNRIYGFYGIFGFLMLILLFVKVLAPKIKIKWGAHVFALLILLLFVAHTGGLITRWYISGHAPWSNGFESMVFIGWTTVLAGLIFYKNSPIALAATSVLTFLILFVAHLSWMNPEITNLVPVLKSYWLTIHVAIITSSYGFLFLGAFMGVLNLLFLIFQNSENKLRIKEKVSEVSRINEMTLIVGLYFLTIGTFLGGIWANESWGRYWGWDPKETWALVSVLVYAFIVHMRFIPGLRGAYAFNFMSVVGYFSILMTYFGVNYYLSGLHSYATGDPMPIPDFVYYTLAAIFMLAVLSYRKYRKYWS